MIYKVLSEFNDNILVIKKRCEHNGQKLKNSLSTGKIHPLNGILLSNKKEKATDVYNTDESQKQKPLPQKYTLYESTDEVLNEVSLICGEKLNSGYLCEVGG